MTTKIVTKIGNLMAVTNGHIVHGCNAQGVMGSGVALAVKNTYPAAYQDYMYVHNNGGLELGQAYAFMPSKELVVWNAITQEHFGMPGRNCSYDAIQSAFEIVNDTVSRMDDLDQEIHIPLIGAGLGGGNWPIIREIIEQTVSYPVTLWVLA